MKTLQNYISNKINIGQNKYVLIIGESPSKGARSPKLWNNAYKYFKKNLKMYPADVSEKNLQGLCNFLKSDKNFLGSSVTMPFKEKIIKYLDKTDMNAATIGSVNTIVKKNNKLIGYNTDYSGALYSIKKTKINKKNSIILILGSGGAGKACIVSTFNYFNKSKIILVNRKKIKLDKFIKRIKNKNKNKIIKLKSYSNLRNIKKIDLIINSTSIGFNNWIKQKSKHYTLVDFCPLGVAKPKLQKIKNKKNFLEKNFNCIRENIRSSINILNNLKKVVVFDIIYNPTETKLIKIAKLFGHKTLNGLDMNLMQAVEGFYIVNQFKKLKKTIAKAMQNGQ